MEIAFRTKALRTVCLSGEAMDERYGAEGGTHLRRCLADIHAAEFLGDVPLLDITHLTANGGRQVALSVGAGLSMIVSANHQRPPKLLGGGIDWHRVERILVQRIGNDHG